MQERPQRIQTGTIQVSVWKCFLLESLIPTTSMKCQQLAFCLSWPPRDLHLLWRYWVLVCGRASAYFWRSSALLQCKWQQACRTKEHDFCCKGPQAPTAGKWEENVCSIGFGGGHFCCSRVSLTHFVICKIQLYIFPNYETTNSVMDHKSFVVAWHLHVLLTLVYFE